MLQARAKGGTSKETTEIQRYKGRWNLMSITMILRLYRMGWENHDEDDVTVTPAHDNSRGEENGTGHDGPPLEGMFPE